MVLFPFRKDPSGYNVVDRLEKGREVGGMAAAVVLEERMLPPPPPQTITKQPISKEVP